MLDGAQLLEHRLSGTGHVGGGVDEEALAHLVEGRFVECRTGGRVGVDGRHAGRFPGSGACGQPLAARLLTGGLVQTS
ncbi:hypothetical protein ACH4TY_28050 [Streptomyces anulatus]